MLKVLSDGVDSCVNDDDEVIYSAESTASSLQRLAVAFS